MLSALISLEATTTNGNDYNGIYFGEGDVKVSNVTSYLLVLQSLLSKPRDHPLSRPYLRKNDSSI